MAGDSEEKSLQASDKKIRDARKKGQLAQHQDASAFTNFAFVVLFMIFFGGAMQTWLEGAIVQSIDLSLTPQSPVDEPVGFGQQIKEVFALVAFPAANWLSMMFFIAVGVAVLTSLVMNRGMVFTFHPMMPSLSKINPIEGFKRIFGKRSIIEFVKAVFKLTLMTVVLLSILLLSIDSMLRLPDCGFDCFGSTFTQLLSTMTYAALAIFLVSALLDIFLQNQLLMDDLKMSKTEVKRELEEQEGKPEIRSAQRSLRREMLEGEAPKGMKAVSFVIYSSKAAVGLRYKPGEQPVPVMVTRATAPNHMKMVQRAREEGAVVIERMILPEQLLASGKFGKAIPREHFAMVADLIIKNKIGQ